MTDTVFPVIDLAATGCNIRRLRLARGLTVRQLQAFFGFEEPRAIYKWQKGECLPTVDNLYALGSLFGVPLEQILVPVEPSEFPTDGQQESSCCPIPLPFARIIPLLLAFVIELVVHCRRWQKEAPDCHGGGQGFFLRFRCLAQLLR